MRFSLHRIPRETKVAAVVLGAALVQVGVLAALGLKSTSDRQDALERGLAERARPIAVNVTVEAAARVGEAEYRLARELEPGEGSTPWIRVQRAMESRIAPVFENAYLVDARGRLTDWRRPPYEATPSGPRDEAARAELAALAALEKTDPAAALVRARTLADSLFAKKPHDVVAAALALQTGWRAAYAAKDRSAARSLAKALLDRGYRTVRDDRGALAESEPMGPAASAMLCRVLQDALTTTTPPSDAFVDAVIERRVQAQRLRPLLSDPAYRVEVLECERLRRESKVLSPALQTTLQTGLEKCDEIDRATLRAESISRAALLSAARGEDATRFPVDTTYLLTVLPLPGSLPREPAGAAFVASPAALKEFALEPAARMASALPEGLALAVRNAADRDVLAPVAGRMLLPEGVPFGSAVPGLHANVALVDASVLERDATSSRNLWLAILLGAALAVLAASLLAVRAVLREVRLARMKSDFVSNLSHELRTPLTSLRMFVETLREGRVRDEAEAKECLDIVAQETDRLQTLVERMLQFGSFTRGRAPIELRSGDAGDVARRAVALFRKRAETARASLELSVADPLPESILDRDAVLQVLLNLLDNAVKYAGHDGARIRVAVAPAVQAGGVVIEVEDDGPGVPEKERVLVFEEFYRGDDTLSRRVEGTGIGLAVARRIVLAHGGTIEALRSERLGGALFRVTLPDASVGRRLALEAADGGRR